MTAFGAPGVKLMSIEQMEAALTQIAAEARTAVHMDMPHFGPDTTVMLLERLADLADGTIHPTCPS